MYDVTRDAALIEALRQGDRVAFRAVVDQFRQKVYNTSLAIVRDADDAEDLTQEVFIEVYESLHSFRADSSLSTWIYRITSNKALEFLRRKKRRQRWAFVQSLVGWETDQKPESVSDFVHPGTQLEDKERSAILFGAINQLPDKQKIAFTLHRIEGLSYQEITEVMQLSLSSVESLMHRAKQNLQKSLRSYYQTH